MPVETAPDAVWVASLSGRTPRPVAAALREAAAQGRLRRHISREHAAEGRPSYGEIDAPLELHALVRLTQTRHVVEVGVSSGVSSAYLLNALDLNGRGTLHSVDLPRRSPPGRTAAGREFGSWTIPPGRSSGWAVPLPLRARWDLRIGDKARVLPLLAEELSAIDLFVYDVPHDDRDAAREFRALDGGCPAGAIVVVDHGPGGRLCPALRAWARRRGARTFGRTGTGLYGARLGPRPARAEREGTSGAPRRR